MTAACPGDHAIETSRSGRPGAAPRQFYVRILGEASVERGQHVVLRAALDGEQERETESGCGTTALSCCSRSYSAAVSRSSPRLPARRPTRRSCARGRRDPGARAAGPAAPRGSPRSTTAAIASVQVVERRERPRGPRALRHPGRVLENPAEGLHEREIAADGVHAPSRVIASAARSARGRGAPRRRPARVWPGWGT